MNSLRGDTSNATSCNFDSCDFRDCSQTSGCKYYYPPNDTHPEQCYASDEDLLHCIHEYIYPSVAELVLAPIFITCFIIGLVGNSLVIWAVCHNAKLRTTTNVLLTNLAVADLMAVLLRMPADFIQTLWETWFLGNVMCKIVEMYQGVVIYASILTLTTISVDRWYAICRSMTFKKTRFAVCILAIWMISHLAAVPRLFIFGAIADPIIPQSLTVLLTSCIPYQEMWSMTFINELVTFVMFYVLPVIIMGCAYTSVAFTLWPSLKPEVEPSVTTTELNTRRRVVKMIIVIVIIFVVCHLPIYVWNMIRFNCWQCMYSLSHETVAGITLGAHLLGLLTSCVNPIIYNFMSVKFRKEFLKAFKCCRQLIAPCRTSEHEIQPVSDSCTHELDGEDATGILTLAVTSSSV